MKRLIYTIPIFILLSLSSVGCSVLLSQYSEVSSDTADAESKPILPEDDSNIVRVGCPDADYPDWETSPYVLPYSVGETYEVRLSNCSSSYHARGRNDEFAFDFVMEEGTLVTAARAGKVVFVEESGVGSEVNNLVVVDHGDETFGAYMHLQLDGALVAVGDVVEQGDAIGLSGTTGLAGYPHLHFIVVQDSWEWPYQGVPITFSNTTPNPHSLASDTEYKALPYAD